MNDHAQQLERAFRYGFTAAVAAAMTRLTLTPDGLIAMDKWHQLLQRWRDAPIGPLSEGWPEIDGWENHEG